MVSSRPSLELLSLVITLPPDDSSLLCRSVNIRNFITEEKEITYHRAIVSSILSKIKGLICFQFCSKANTPTFQFAELIIRKEGLHAPHVSQVKALGF